LALIVQQYELHLVPGYPVEEEVGITLRPRYGVHMTLHSRR
jgi:hypothetical protein